MSTRVRFLRSIAAAASLALLPFATESVHAAGAPAVRSVPLPIDFSLTAAQIDDSCQSEIAAAGKRIDALVRARSARTFRTVVEPLENTVSDLSDNLGAQVLLFNVAPDKAVRDASERCNTAVTGYLAELFARPDLYQALAAAARSHTARGPAQRKLTEIHLLAAKRAGAGLPADQRERFVAIARQIADLENAFMSNLSNANTTITITKEQADGLKPDLAGRLKTNADGRLVVPVNESSFTQFLANATSADARKAFYMAYYTRGGEKNVELLQKAIALRDEAAKLLGYPNWAAYTLADRMAGTPERVENFLASQSAALLPLAREQRAKLAELKGAPLDEWDRPFYSDIARKKQFNLDPEAVRQYFPAQHTIDAVLDFYSHMLGLTFTKSADLPTWHPEVVGYKVTDTATGADRGVFYLDLYPRDGKYGHFANFGPTSRRVMPDGTARPAVNTIIGNWPAPAPGKPSLLSHQDVLVFFHEFGHNVAALCADTPYETLNNGYRQDFVEAPSQMLENFTWNPAILRKITSDAVTGEPMPDAMIASLNAGRHFNQAWTHLGTNVFYALVDQRYHSSAPPVDTTAVWAATRARYTADPFVAGTLPQAGFTHLMGGYEGTYYGYAWAKVYAMDLFTAFQKDGLQNPAVGLRYRRDILAPARLQEPDVLVKKFLGRPMSPEAFYADLGIKGEAK
ncbi:MAG: Zn-dependent oligopeptidase [Burkholderiales bacterium]|nr:Zn-dependent oligopeptidase [Burkholderiales bacterium]